MVCPSIAVLNRIASKEPAAAIAERSVGQEVPEQNAGASPVPVTVQIMLIAANVFTEKIEARKPRTTNVRVFMRCSLSPDNPQMTGKQHQVLRRRSLLTEKR